MYQSPLDLIAKAKKKPLKNMKHIINRQYSIAPETEKVSLDENRCISFIPGFRYLGSWISYDLNDIFDIDSRIKKVNQVMGLCSSRHTYQI